MKKTSKFSVSIQKVGFGKQIIIIFASIVAIIDSQNGCFLT